MAGEYLLLCIWLRYFRQGPVEWLWRQLTCVLPDRQYLKHQDNDLDHIRNKTAVTVSIAVTRFTKSCIHADKIAASKQSFTAIS